MFSNNIVYPLTVAAEKPSAHVMHTGSNSKIILCHPQQVENNTDFAYFKSYFGLLSPNF